MLEMEIFEGGKVGFFQCFGVEEGAIANCNCLGEPIAFGEVKNRFLDVKKVFFDAGDGEQEVEE